MPIEKFAYIAIMLLCIIFPLGFSFDKKVRFYKKWPQLIVAIIIPAIFFVSWDVWFTSRGIWGFSLNYTLGFQIFGLPVEELLFFIVVPYCSIFVYEVLKLYFPKLDYMQQFFWSLIVLNITFVVLAIFFNNQVYTFWNFIFNAIFLFFLLKNVWFLQHITHFLFAFFVCLIPMFIVNGLLTALPIVEYNVLQISGIKMYTIPVEDFFYFFLLLMMNVFTYERMLRVKF